MKSVAKKDDAVSPVIGTILLVAITVVLVAIVAAVVMGMVGNMGETKTVGATATTANGLITGTVTGGTDANKLTGVNVSVVNVSSGNSVYRKVTGNGVELVGQPITVGANSVSGATGTTAFPAGAYTFTITGTFSDDTAQVLSTGTLNVAKKA